MARSPVTMLYFNSSVYGACGAVCARPVPCPHLFLVGRLLLGCVVYSLWYCLQWAALNLIRVWALFVGARVVWGVMYWGEGRSGCVYACLGHGFVLGVCFGRGLVGVLWMGRDEDGRKALAQYGRVRVDCALDARCCMAVRDGW